MCDKVSLRRKLILINNIFYLINVFIVVFIMKWLCEYYYHSLFIFKTVNKRGKMQILEEKKN